VKYSRRGSERSSLDVSFEFQGQVLSLSQNISQSGMLCRTSRQIEELTILDIRFQLPRLDGHTAGPFWIECSGVVVRCEKTEADGLHSSPLPYEVAIYFDDISDTDRDILAGYVTS
jgi:hypothetical protein